MKKPRDSANGTSTSTVHLNFEGKQLAGKVGESVATAILAGSAVHSGTSPVTGRRKSPYCLMGICFECLMEIDGVPNQRACMVLVRPGMSVRRQMSRPRLVAEVPGE